MKKTLVWILGAVMAFSFTALIFLQVRYLNEMVQLRQEQFDENVKRSLYAATHKLEVYETMRYLESDAAETARRLNAQGDSIRLESENPVGTLQRYNIQMKDGRISAFEVNTITVPSRRPSVNTTRSIPEASEGLRDVIRKRYANQRAVMDEVIYNILYTASERPLEQRINFRLLDRDLQEELLNNGITLPYHFSVSTADGREIYHCPDYEEHSHKGTYTQILFRNDPPNRMGVLKVHFPDAHTYLLSSVRFLVPSIFFTAILLITFLFTLAVIMRQKRASEIKNDFINNMTHELKTPISTISLAAQMLGDGSLAKSPEMNRHISTIIGDETKRLRFLVEKVLQMSMFDRRNTSLKFADLDINELAGGVAHTFDLKVQKYGGTLVTQLDATRPMLLADEMHITNVLFNLLDNAVKYRREEVPLSLVVRTWNDGDSVCLSVGDNGIGIRKDDLKRIFDRFFRVHTGNKHDVKGFGLGLAYVKQIVNQHNGTIKAESELGVGTTFHLTFPIAADN